MSRRGRSAAALRTATCENLRHHAAVFSSVIGRAVELMSARYPPRRTSMLRSNTMRPASDRDELELELIMRRCVALALCVCLWALSLTATADDSAPAHPRPEPATSANQTKSDAPVKRPAGAKRDPLEPA